MPTAVEYSAFELTAGGSRVKPTSHSLRRSLWVAVILAIILAMTRVVELGDTEVYAKDIADHLGNSPFGSGNSLWEFGHLLWRPLGWVLLTGASPLLSNLTRWSSIMQASFLLMSVSVISALVTVVLWHVIAYRVTASKSVAFAVAISTACSHGFLLYSHSGCAYVPGVACLTASFYFLLERRIAAGAIFYALSVLLWFPFILAGAGLLLPAANRSDDWHVPLKEPLAQPVWRRAMRFTVISAAAVVLVYGCALGARRVSSASEARAWVSGAAHGFSQSNRVVRIATGLPRSFLYLGQDGILYKRYLRRDPYAPVTLRDIAGASLWKIAAFDLFVLCLLYELLRKDSAWMLLLFLAGSVPVIFFAVAIFEPGSPERYLPALPFFMLASAWILRDIAARRRFTQLAVAAFLLCVVLANSYSFAAPRISGRNRAALARVSDLKVQLGSAGIAMIATNQDELLGTLSRLVFDKINSPSPFPLWDIIEPGNVRVLTWRQDLAVRALNAWSKGGEVWVSRRLWSQRPLPRWNWVEGDDPRISWKDLPPFFAALSTDAESGGADGFLRLVPGERNFAFLKHVAAHQ